MSRHILTDCQLRAYASLEVALEIAAEQLTDALQCAMQTDIQGNATRHACEALTQAHFHLQRATEYVENDILASHLQDFETEGAA